MYLHLLDENQKIVFLKLAVALASVDGEYSKEEKMLVDSYCKEMNIYQFEMEKEPIQEIVEEFIQITDEQIRKIVLFESAGLIMCDGKYDKSEKDVIEYIEHEFGLTKGFANQCIDFISEYMKFQNKLNDIVLR